MKTTGKTWKELETTTTDREQWKSLVSALCATKRVMSVFFDSKYYFPSMNIRLEFLAS